MGKSDLFTRRTSYCASKQVFFLALVVSACLQGFPLAEYYEISSCSGRSSGQDNVAQQIAKIFK